MSRRVGHYLTDIIPEEHRWKLELFHNWETIIGSLKDKVRIEKIADNSLILGVCHPAWAQELFFLTPMLKEKINKILRKNRITDIRVRTTDFSSKQQNTAVPRPQCGTINADHGTMQIEQCLTIYEHGSLQNIKSTELQSALAKFYLRCKTNHQKKGERDEKNQKSRAPS